MEELDRPYPLVLRGEQTEPLSRGLWLVKWLLALPHYVILAFLAAAFIVVSIIAFFAILFTGRYPRGLFDFNAGVLRWSWRVGFYGYQALGTDRYPPFSLERKDYPAELEIEYPEHLSHGLVLVKWFLAIPHYAILALLTGWGQADWWREGWNQAADAAGRVPFGGLLWLLVLIAVVVLLFTGRYPRDIFELIMGINRWLYRVIAYIALMTDRYPPFRLRE